MFSFDFIKRWWKSREQIIKVYIYDYIIVCFFVIHTRNVNFWSVFHRDDEHFYLSKFSRAEKCKLYGFKSKHHTTRCLLSFQIKQFCNSIKVHIKIMSDREPKYQRLSTWSGRAAVRPRLKDVISSLLRLVSALAALQIMEDGARCAAEGLCYLGSRWSHADRGRTWIYYNLSVVGKVGYLFSLTSLYSLSPMI